MHLQQEVQRSVTFRDCPKEDVLDAFTPLALKALDRDQTVIPRLSRDKALLADIAAVLPNLPTFHRIHLTSATKLDFVPSESVHLVVTSPPYWTLKKYNDGKEQMGSIADYEEFLAQLDQVWRHCYRVLVPGGRLVCVVGDVCLSRRNNNGRHAVVPLHASIVENCRRIGFDNLAPIIWYKIANASYEAGGTSSFLGKPYEPNGIIKNDIEFILMQRKHGGYRSPSFLERAMSVISDENHKLWFNQIWSGLPGASTREHPAPYPLELAQRLIRMFSFVGDVVLDPFLGTGTTCIAAIASGRNSIGIEVDPDYLDIAERKILQASEGLFTRHSIAIAR